MRRIQKMVTLFGVLCMLWLTAGSVKAAESVIPGGQSIGIKLRAAGVLVVGYHFIHSGRSLISPGEQANIHVGDMIIKVNGNKADHVEELAKSIIKAGTQGKPLVLELKRKNQVIFANLLPKWDDDTGSYRIGLYIRDSASGVGTLTFVDPKIHAFAALGHVVTDADTGQAIEGQGEIVHATVTSINRGQSGQPGEKRGSFVNERHRVGTILHNNEYGVFGSLSGPFGQGFSKFNAPLPIADPDEVTTGPAKILTVIHNQEVEAFDVRIIKVNSQSLPHIKSFIIQVTDPRLLRLSGGIVQGMSGSPVIAGNKLVGAVTHVFLSDPTRGYGVYAAWMERYVQDVNGAA